MIDTTKEINIFNCDYKTMLKEIPDKCVDALVTDPPYLISRKTNFSSMNGRGGNVCMNFGGTEEGWDTVATQGSIEELLEPMFKECQRILKENANVIVFNSWQNLGKIADMMLDNHIAPKRPIVLKKSNEAPFNMNRMLTNNCEFAIWGVYNSKDKPTNWTYNNEKEKIGCVFDTTVQNSVLHPTQKDPMVIQKLTQLFTNKGDLVLDCFMGSNTQGIVCKANQRRFIGFELDKDYFEKAKRRIENNDFFVEKPKVDKNKMEGQMSILDFLNGTGEKE